MELDVLEHPSARGRPINPREATLSVVLDAAAGDDIFNPDNLGISDTALVIQEDRTGRCQGSTASSSTTWRAVP